MSGSKHVGPNLLSRRLREDDDSKSDEEDVEDTMDADSAALRGEAGRVYNEQVEAAEEDEEVEGENEHERATENDAPENDVLEDFPNVIHYLTTFERPEGLTPKKYLQFQSFEGENEHESDTQNDASEDDILEDFCNVIHYLTMFERPEGLTPNKYLQFQGFTTKFLLQDGILFRCAKPNMPPKRVVWNLKDRNSIISELHDESEHRGRQGTYTTFTLRY